MSSRWTAPIAISILLIVTILSTLTSGLPNPTSGDCVEDYEVKHLSLSLTYGPGYCNSIADKCRGSYSGFSIHGLWPQVKGMNDNQRCCSKERNLVSKLQPMMPKLRTDWRNLRGNDNWLWEHEWDNHGRCAHKVPAINTAPLYFQFALDQFAKLKPMSHMRAAGISASNKKVYQGQQIADAFEAAYGHRVEVVCKGAKDGGKMILTEVRICYKTDLSLKDCGFTKNRCLGDLYVLAE